MKPCARLSGGAGALSCAGFLYPTPSALCLVLPAAGRLYKLVPQMIDAGICGSQSSGIIEYLADGSRTKRLHPWSRTGDCRGCWRARGFLGPATVLEGRHGLYKAFGGDGDYQGEVRGAGAVREIPKIAFKSYPCGSISHPYMDCVALQKYMLRADDIDEVRCARRRVGAAALGADSRQAPPANLLRCQIQLALQSCLHASA
jgi:2-methylcitrate dehydratase PrpD